MGLKEDLNGMAMHLGADLFGVASGKWSSNL